MLGGGFAGTGCAARSLSMAISSIIIPMVSQADSTNPGETIVLGSIEGLMTRAMIERRSVRLAPPAPPSKASSQGSKKRAYNEMSENDWQEIEYERKDLNRFPCTLDHVVKASCATLVDIVVDPIVLQKMGTKLSAMIIDGSANGLDRWS